MDLYKTVRPWCIISLKPLTFFIPYNRFNIMAKTKKKGKTMREYPNGVRKGKYKKISYTSRKRKGKAKEEDDGFGLPEW